jgi:RNA polymerase sigma-70 factor (ECF subfamily)
LAHDRTASGGVFDELFRSEYPRLVALAAHLLGDRALAEDVAQDEVRRATRERAALGRRGPDREEADTRVSGPPDLIDAVSALPLNQRIALVLVDGDGLSPNEAGGVMGCAPSTVRVHLHRARRALRSSLSACTSESGRRQP